MRAFSRAPAWAPLPVPLEPRPLDLDVDHEQRERPVIETDEGITGFLFGVCIHELREWI